MVDTNCAVCLLEGGLVVNIIVCAPTDLPPDGCELVEIMTGVFCDIGWSWNGVQFNPPIVQQIEV